MENNIHKRIGAHLKYARINYQKKTQDQAADEFFVTLKTWQRYEQGITPVPVELVVQLNEKWGIDPNWLLLDMEFDKCIDHSPYRKFTPKGAVFGPKTERK